MSPAKPIETEMRPDHQTKVAAGWMYGVSMSVILFLCAQVWSMNGNMSSLLAQQEAQLRDNMRSEERDKEIKADIRDLRADVKHLAEQMNSKGD